MDLKNLNTDGESVNISGSFERIQNFKNLRYAFQVIALFNCFKSCLFRKLNKSAEK